MSDHSRALFRRNKRSVNNCPDCGVFVCYNYQNLRSDCRVAHTCDQEFVKRSERSQDAAMRRDPDNEEPRKIPLSERLATGFQMLRDDDCDDDDD